MSEQDRQPNALGMLTTFLSGHDSKLDFLANAMIDRLRENPGYLGVVPDSRNEVVGMVVLPVIRRVETYATTWANGFLLVTADDQPDDTLNPTAVAEVLRSAQQDWYRAANGRRFAALQAYADGLLSIDGVAETLGESWDVTKRFMGLDYLPPERTALGQLLGRLKATLAE